MASRHHRKAQYLGFPELIEPIPGPWEIAEVSIQDAAVDLTNRRAQVPEALTPAQRLARMHEWGHVKLSPSPYQPDGDWPNAILTVTRLCVDRGITPDPGAVSHISKMLEENRVDWLLWDEYGIDIRGAREVLDWTLMPDPETDLQALGECLQLAWTVWASRGLGKGIPNLPPPRVPDAATGEYFDKCWKYLLDNNRPIAVAMIRGCRAMYENPSHARRNEVAAELAALFPAQTPESKQPPQKPAEQEAQQQARRDHEMHEQYLEEMETGVGSEAQTIGGIQYHDHTARIRRPSMRIARRGIPVAQGIDMRYAHRYLLDKAIFRQRLLTEGGLMIDGSGSMHWTNDDLVAVVNALPAIRVGIYHGMWQTRADRDPAYARICTLAKEGRFAVYPGKDPGASAGNDADLEALQLLATWPKPRFWLSDGLVCGGKHLGPPRYHAVMGRYTRSDGRLHELCSALMKRHEIVRVPSREVLFRLLARQRVTLYRTTRAGLDAPDNHGADVWWPETVRPEPVTFSL
jgi:hypothetical protein